MLTKSLWQSAATVGETTNFIANQDSKGITGTVATDREIGTWHGLTDIREV